MSLAAALLLAAAQGAPESVWLKTSTAEEFEAAYPKPLRKFAYAGRAELECAVGPEGRLSGCQVVAEEPAGKGFGDAAMKLSRAFQARPPASGQGVVRVPITFRLAHDTQPPPLQVASARYAGLTAQLDCRYDNFVLDNCFVLDVSRETAGLRDTALAAAAKAQFRQTRYLTGRMLLTLQFVEPNGRPEGLIAPPATGETPRRGRASSPPVKAARDAAEPRLKGLTVTAGPKSAEPPPAYDPAAPAASYYPLRASYDDVGGDVLLRCRLTQAGAEGCEVIDESPKGHGFGKHAIYIAEKNVKVRANSPPVAEGATVLQPVSFRIPANR